MDSILGKKETVKTFDKYIKLQQQQSKIKTFVAELIGNYNVEIIDNVFIEFHSLRGIKYFNKIIILNEKNYEK